MACLSNKIFCIRSFLTDAKSKVICKVVVNKDTSHIFRTCKRFHSLNANPTLSVHLRSGCFRQISSSQHHCTTQDEVNRSKEVIQNNDPCKSHSSSSSGSNSSSSNSCSNINKNILNITPKNILQPEKETIPQSSTMKIFYDNISKLTTIYDSEIITRALNSITLELPKSLTNSKDYWWKAWSRINLNFTAKPASEGGNQKQSINLGNHLRNQLPSQSDDLDIKNNINHNYKTPAEESTNVIETKTEISAGDNDVKNLNDLKKCETIDSNLNVIAVAMTSTKPTSCLGENHNDTALEANNNINNNIKNNNDNNNDNVNNNNNNNNSNNDKSEMITFNQNIATNENVESKTSEVLKCKETKRLNLTTNLSNYSQSLTDQISSTASGAVNVTVGAIKNLSSYWPMNISLPKSLSFNQDKPDLDIEELKQLTTHCDTPTIRRPRSTTSHRQQQQQQQQQQHTNTSSSSSSSLIQSTTTSHDHKSPTSIMTTTTTTTTTTKESKFRVIKEKVDWESLDNLILKQIHALRRGVRLKDEEAVIDMLQELCHNFVHFHRTRCLAEQSKIIPTLLRLRFDINNNNSNVINNNVINNNVINNNNNDNSNNNSNNDNLKILNDYINQSLCLLGYVEPLKKRGVRVLTLDGGGTRGLITLNILKQLEHYTGRRIYQLFDYVCGVSTGALIGVISCAFRLSLTKTEDIYKKFSRKMFARNRLAGVGKLFMSHAYYDTEFWEGLLQNNIGGKSFVDTMMDPECPKLSIVSTLMNAPRVQNFLFRNYNHPYDRQSRYWGSVEHRLWQSIRASSAAPGYFEEYELDGLIHQDGGLLTNNPTAIALHECKLLWPDAPIQCIVSIGTGQYEAKSSPDLAAKSSLKAKIMKIIESATDTEAVHMVLHDLLPPSTYFRFNPPLSQGFLMDETREEMWSMMQADSQMYCRKNQVQLENVARQLMLNKSKMETMKDWTKFKLRTTLDY